MHAHASIPWDGWGPEIVKCRNDILFGRAKHLQKHASRARPAWQGRQAKQATCDEELQRERDTAVVAQRMAEEQALANRKQLKKTFQCGAIQIGIAPQCGRLL